MEVEQSSISQLENGKQGFDSATLYRLSSRLNLPLSDLFAFMEKRKDPQLPAEAVALAAAWLSLPVEDRKSYKERIEALASVYKKPVPDERLTETGAWKAPKRLRPQRRKAKAPASRS